MMRKKVLMILLCGFLLVGLAGCGGKENKKGITGSILFDYSKINTNSENIGKTVDVKTVLNEDINPSSYEGVEFDININNLSNLNKEAGNLNWVILAEDDNHYLLTTIKATSDSIQLKGSDGYNNGVQALNAYCAKYYSVEVGGKKYVARSLNVSDIEAYYKDKTDTWKQDVLGFEDYNKKGMEAKGYLYYPSLYAKESGSNMGGTLGVSESLNGYEPYNDGRKSDGTSTSNYTNTYYYANKNEMKDNFANSKAYSIIFDASAGYWVSSRTVKFYDGKMTSYEKENGSRNTPASVTFNMRTIGGGELKSFRLADSGSMISEESFYKNTLSVRPVVVVPKSEIDL